MKIGGRIELLTPETFDEFKDLVCRMQTESHPYCMIGRGSNSVIADTTDVPFIVTTRIHKVTHLGDGRFFVEAGAPLQKIIKTARAKGFGGIEFLNSVPGTLGGAVFMNAGENVTSENHLGRFVEEVVVFRRGGMMTVPASWCRFGYRTSIFHYQPDTVIAGAILKLLPMTDAEIKSGLDRRAKISAGFYDMSAPNAGSIYVVDRKLRGAKGPVRWSSKTPNWILNTGRATLADLLKLIPTRDGLEIQILPKQRMQ